MVTTVSGIARARVIVNSELITGSFWRFCPTSVGSQIEFKKRSRRFCLILIITVFSIAIITGVIVFELSNAGQTSYGPGPVDIEVTTDKPFYLAGEEVYFTVYVNNSQNWPVPFPFYPGYSVDRDGVNIAGGGVHITYEMPMPTFPANSRTLFNCSAYHWNQKMYLNETFPLEQAPPGNYTLTVYFEGEVDYGEASKCTFEIRLAA